MKEAGEQWGMTCASDNEVIARRVKQALFVVIFTRTRCNRESAVRNAAGWVGNWMSSREEYLGSAHTLVAQLAGYAYDHRERLGEELRTMGFALLH
jgi:hypothetical protein